MKKHQIITFLPDIYNQGLYGHYCRLLDYLYIYRTPTHHLYICLMYKYYDYKSYFY
jgi:hypothetical protein